MKRKSGMAPLDGESLWTSKERRFACEYVKDLNPVAAARRAGFADPDNGFQLLMDMTVSREIQDLWKQIEIRYEVTQDKVLLDLEQTRRWAMEAGSFASALRAVELMGKHLGMFVNKANAKLTEKIIESHEFTEEQLFHMAQEVVQKDGQ
ncbi:MAG: terminase small subunit [Magnetococcus sp. DMHC-6]